MPAHHYPFIDLAVHASVRDHFAKGDAVAVLSRDLDEVLWANGAAAQLFGFSNIYDALDEGLSGQTSTRRQIESAVSGLARTGKPQSFMMRASGGFSRRMAPAMLEEIALPDGAQALLLTSSQAGQVLAPGARARQIIAGFEGTGTHVAVLDKDGTVLAASSTFSEIALSRADIERMVTDVTDAADRLVKRMTESSNGAMPTAIGRLADEPALHLLFAVEPAPADETVPEETVPDETMNDQTVTDQTVTGGAMADGPVAGDAISVDEGGGETDTADEGPDMDSAAPETGQAQETEDAPEADLPSETETSSGEQPAGEAAADSPQEAEAGPTAEPDTTPEPPRRTFFFDTRRIRDELNARLAKAQRESEIPAAFEEARGLEVPEVSPSPSGDGSDAEEAREADDRAAEAGESTAVEDTAPEVISDEVPASESGGAEQETSLPDGEDVPVRDTNAMDTEQAPGETDEPGLQPAQDRGEDKEHGEDAGEEASISTELAEPSQDDGSGMIPDEAPAPESDDDRQEVSLSESQEVEVQDANAAETEPAPDEAGEPDTDRATDSHEKGEHFEQADDAASVDAGSVELSQVDQPEDLTSEELPAAAEDHTGEGEPLRESAETEYRDEGPAEPDKSADEGEQPETTSAQDDEQLEAESALSDEQPETPAGSAAGFRFDPSARPARFVWKINRDGEFSEVSPEFAASVGPNSADIIGRSFPDLARVFNLDPDHVISDLLSRRDTWSGKTVLWPIQGTDMVTPVDLAALPTYTRDRQFDGFRGFGIVRISEARKDPEALGLALVPGRVSPAVEAMRDDYTDTRADDEPAGPIDHDMSTIDDDADLEMRNLERDIEDLARMDGIHDEATEEERLIDEANRDAASDINDNETGAGEDKSDETNIDEADPFRGERPAIRLVETPMRRESDKVISLEAHRPRTARESLSPGEQAAFREIGARLSETTAKPSNASAETEEATTGAPTGQQTPPPFGKRQEPPRGDDTADAGEIPADGKGSDSPAHAQDDQPEAAASETGEGPSPEQTGNEAPSPAAAEEPAETPESVAEAPAPLPSAFALPARQVMPSGLDASIIDAIPAALLVHSGDELIHGNAEFLELTGYGSLADLADQGGLDHLLERPGEDDGEADGGLFVRRGDGSRREVTARLRSVNWGEGQALLLALSPRESERRIAADEPAHLQGEASEEPEPVREESHLATALAIEAQELRSILETATDGVVILNNDGTIRSMNGSACALFNYDEAETRDQPFAMLFAHESQRAVMDYVGGLADHGVSSVLNDGREVIGREASGGFLPLFMTIGRLSGSNGYCAVLRDITQWKRTEEELRNAKRAAETANSHKSDFLARVSHEIRTPLNAIIGFSEMMVEERFGPIGSPRYLEYAHDIGNSGKHVLDIVNDLLDISKIEAGQVSMEFVSVSLNDHLAESVSLLQPMANSQRVIIRTSLSASVPDVVADQRSIKQIALNLLSNAIRYTPSGGQIVVSTSYEPAGNVVIRIRDTGIGMNRKELEQAMKPFGQVGTGPRQRGDGTGLGLPLTKAMVEANRAQFDIVSAPGEGTLVSISFPPQRVLAD